MEPKILYEDNEVLAIDKPAGLVVHGNGKITQPTLADWVLKKYPELKDVGEPSKILGGQSIPRPGIIHRLDKETSGVMLIAKTAESFASLKEQFQKHLIQKTYFAFVYGEVKNEKGIIDRKIGRSNKDFRMWSAQRGAKGELREAETAYKVLTKAKGYSFLEIMPKTGRTHQIRVHFKAINYPLVADSLYAPNRQNILGFKRLALHSHKIVFADRKGKLQTISAPFPEDFENATALLQSS